MPPASWVVRSGLLVHLSLYTFLFQNVNACPVGRSKGSHVSSWYCTFKIPDRDVFSGWTQRSIDTGVVTSRARREIVQTLRTLISQHTKYPTRYQYSNVCEKLVTKFVMLQDMDGTGYVSSNIIIRKGLVPRPSHTSHEKRGYA